MSLGGYLLSHPLAYHHQLFHDTRPFYCRNSVARRHCSACSDSFQPHYDDNWLRGEVDTFNRAEDSHVR
jgi:hypothetical protein